MRSTFSGAYDERTEGEEVVRDIRLGRNARSLLSCMLDDYMDRVKRNLRIAEEHQHMTEFKTWCELEHQAKRIRKALELAS